jgi:hypothetical protein
VPNCNHPVAAGFTDSVGATSQVREVKLGVYDTLAEIQEHFTGKCGFLEKKAKDEGFAWHRGRGSPMNWPLRTDYSIALYARLGYVRAYPWTSRFA